MHVHCASIVNYNCYFFREATHQPGCPSNIHLCLPIKIQDDSKESVNAWSHQLLQRRRVSNESFDLIIHCHLLFAIEPLELFLDRVKRLVRQCAQIDGLVVVLASLLIKREIRAC